MRTIHYRAGRFMPLRVINTTPEEYYQVLLNLVNTGCEVHQVR
jgi:hypothetical protein